MLKKFAIAAIVVGSGLGFLHATGLSSYTSTAVAKVRNSFKKSVPLEFEIERLRHEVSQLVPEMRQNFSRIAEEMVAVENLSKEINTTTAKLAQQKDRLLAMAQEVESGKVSIVYGDRKYSHDRAKAKLERDWASYKACETELKSKEQLLEAKQASLDATKEKLGAIKVQKQELEVAIAQLEAELRTVRLAQTRNKIHFDDSRLARCKAAVQEIKNRLNAERHVQALAGEFDSDIVPVEKKAQPTGELINEIRTHLGSSEEPKSSVAENK